MRVGLTGTMMVSMMCVVTHKCGGYIVGSTHQAFLILLCGLLSHRVEISGE